MTSAATSTGTYAQFLKVDGRSTGWTGGTSTGGGNPVEANESNNLAALPLIWAR
jgi:hypothetical protein